MHPIPSFSNEQKRNQYLDDCVVIRISFLASDEDYILQFAPPFNRLELLQAQSCPDAITNHVEQS